MSDGPDPLEHLRTAWARQHAAPPGEALEAQDAATQASVRYLREAWNAATPARSAEVPADWRVPARPRSLLRPVPLATLLAAAAAALLLWLRPVAEPVPADAAEQLADAGGELEPEPKPETAAPQPAVPARRAVTDTYTPRDDGLELRSGAVRLILIAPGPSDSGSPTNS